MKRGNSRRLLFLLLIGFWNVLPGTLTAQSPEFIATVSSAKVARHGVFEIQFELKDAKGSSFQPPSFGNFKVVNGPSMGSSTMIINGVVSQSQSWTYALLAPSVGKFTIGSASVVAGRKKLTTRPVTIEVLEQKDQVKQGANGNTKDQVLLVAETNATTYYPGQQIILTYRLLFRENIQTVSTLSEDDYADFFVQHFSDFSRESETRMVNGLPYTARIVKSMALFAHQSGTYTIDPLVMNAGINAPFPGNQGFFTMRRIMDVQVASEPITINILSLPPGAPESFSGAVGQYQMKMTPGKSNISTDEAFTFQLEIKGNGDARRWDVPKPVSDVKFELYDPKITEDRVFDENNELIHVRAVTYNMIPEQPGDYKVYIPFTYFDPAGKKYVTIASDTISLHVTQGTGVRVDSLDSQKASGEELTLMPVGHLLFKDKFWVSIPHLLLFALLLSGSGYGVILASKRKRENLISAAERNRMAASAVAHQQLNELNDHSSDMDTAAFFETATQIFYTFLTDRFSIPPSELDQTNISQYLRKANIREEDITQTVAFFNECLEVRYGGIPGGYSRPEMIRKCREVVDLIGA